MKIEMKRMNWVVLMLCVGLWACGGPADEAVGDTDEYDDSGSYEDESYAEEDEGVFDPMVGTIDRAKAVEDMNMDRKDRMDAAIEGSE